MKIGDYVRIDGYISKIGHIKTSSSGKIYAQWKQPNGLLASGNVNIIEKSSPNIIDLIEVGDYVNGCPVLFKEKNELVCGLLLRYKEENIQNVVTKEQFESMEYKI